MNYRERLKGKKRIVVKIGTSSLTHKHTGELNLYKLERLVRVLADLRNQGRDIVLVSSGAIGMGRSAAGLKERPTQLPVKQACAAIGQARLMMMYQKLFSEYNQLAAQILMTKNVMLNPQDLENTYNTFNTLLDMGAIPVVNENDTVSTHEIQFGDNDTLSAVVAALIHADFLVVLTDIDGLYTDDPHANARAHLVTVVERMDSRLNAMAKESSGSGMGTGGMATKLRCAKIATVSGADMVIASGADPEIIYKILEGEECGTLFLAHKDEEFRLTDYI